MVPDADVTIIDAAPPGLVPKNHPLVDHLITSGELTQLPKQAWTDVGRFSAHGIDAVNFGPGNVSECHCSDERVEVRQLEGCAKVIADVAESLMFDS